MKIFNRIKSRKVSAKLKEYKKRHAEYVQHLQYFYNLYKNESTVYPVIIKDNDKLILTAELLDLGYLHGDHVRLVKENYTLLRAVYIGGQPLTAAGESLLIGH